MKHFALLITLAVVLGVAADEPAKAPANLDFETGKAGEVPEGWHVPQPAEDAGYTAVLSTEKPYAGKQCALISRASGTQGFGNLMQCIDAEKYRGRRVRIKAAVRADVAGVGNHAMLWLRVDRKDGQPGFFENMYDRPIRKNEWAEYEIVGDVAVDAVTLNFGCMLMGNGKAWLDAASLDDLGKAGEGDEPAKPLTDRGLANLIAFAKLYGYLRYFHPSDEAAAADWETFAIDGVRQIQNARDAKDLADQLQKLAAPLAPTVRVFVTGESPKPEPLPKGTRTLAWIHHGVGTGSHQIYYSKRIDEKATILKANGPRPELKLPDIDKPFVADLGGGVSCTVPLTLPADLNSTLPKASAKPTAGVKPAGWRPSGNDRATRLAAVVIAWNIFQHFYPYFDVMKIDWPSELKTALTAAATDKDEQAFLTTLRHLVAALQDGHGSVHLPSAGGAAPLPLEWDWIENKLIITRAPKALTDDLKPGDAILRINGRNVAELIAEEEKSISGATPQWKRHMALSRLQHPPAGDVKFAVQRRPGVVKTVAIDRAMEPAEEEPGEGHPAKIEELQPDIWYVDIDRISEKDYRDALPKLEKAKGIVFDLRGYPKTGFHGIANIIDKPVTCAQWHIPLTLRPDREGMAFQFSNWEVQPAKPRFTAKIAYLTGGGAISAAETYMGIIEHYKLAAIVGGPTAGTNGNVNPFKLPGGYSVSWTGMKVLKHDGSRHHGVGIQPTVPVTRTVAGVAAGKDEVLDAGIKAVKTEKP